MGAIDIKEKRGRLYRAKINRKKSFIVTLGGLQWTVMYVYMCTSVYVSECVCVCMCVFVCVCIEMECIWKNKSISFFMGWQLERQWGSYQRHRPRNEPYWLFTCETMCRARHHNELNNWFTSNGIIVLVTLLILVVPFIEIHVKNDNRSCRQSCK